MTAHVLSECFPGLAVRVVRQTTSPICFLLMLSGIPAGLLRGSCWPLQLGGEVAG